MTLFFLKRNFPWPWTPCFQKQYRILQSIIESPSTGRWRMWSGEKNKKARSHTNFLPFQTVFADYFPDVIKLWVLFFLKIFVARGVWGGCLFKLWLEDENQGTEVGSWIIRTEVKRRMVATSEWIEISLSTSLFLQFFLIISRLLAPLKNHPALSPYGLDSQSFGGWD